MEIQVPFLPNIYHPEVMSRLQELEEKTRSGVGIVLPPGKVIGQCLQKFVDESTKAQLEQGIIRINPLGHAGTIISRYI